MFNKAFGGMAGLGAFSSAAAITTAPQAIGSDHPSNPTPLWIAAAVFAAIFVAGAIGWLFTRDDASRAKMKIGAKASNHSIAQVAGRDAVSVGNIVQQSVPPPILIEAPETRGFLESGIWWEYVRYEPLSLLVGERVPEVWPYCPMHKDYALHFQPRFPGGDRGNIRALDRSNKPVLDEKRPLDHDGYMVCAYDKGHDVFMDAGTDSLINAWTRAEAKVAAQIRETKRREDEAGVFFVGGPDD